MLRFTIPEWTTISTAAAAIGCTPAELLEPSCISMARRLIQLAMADGELPPGTYFCEHREDDHDGE